MNYDISIIFPIYNEEDNLQELFQSVDKTLSTSGKAYELIFVNDGSTDNSVHILEDLYQKNKGKVKVVHFARNFGHQLALSAGFKHCKGRAAVVMDADLQDPPETILDFIDEWEKGSEIVYGVRAERQGETFFKKATASLFYKLIRGISGIDIPENAGDFYLLDRRIVDILNSLKERHRFLRGLIAWVGYKRTAVSYVRKPRHAGETKYPFWKMFKFSLDAITSFSFAPLKLVSFLGMVFSGVAFLAILIIIYMKLFTDQTITGWSSLMAVILFIGGVQLLAIGIIGEYVARIGDDVKERPLYTIKDFRE